MSTRKRQFPLPGPAMFLSLAWHGPARAPRVDDANANTTEAVLTRDAGVV